MKKLKYLEPPGKEKTLKLILFNSELSTHRCETTPF